MVFICGIINVLITVTNIRRLLIIAIPNSLQNAISAGIGAGGRTGFTSVITALCFIVAMFFSPLLAIVPAEATAPSLIIVGILMLSSLNHIDWDNFEVAVPAFFASIFMGFAYSISDGIAAGFISYGIIALAQGKAKKVHPILWISMGLFILNYIVMAIL